MTLRRNEPIVQDGPYRTAPIVAIVAFVLLAIVAFFFVGQNVRLPRLPELAPALDPQNQQAPPRDQYETFTPPADAPDCGGKPC
ncbi:MAG: hypothetical protein AB7J28_14650 [Hyphomonadaceae bacterium]